MTVGERLFNRLCSRSVHAAVEALVPLLHVAHAHRCAQSDSPYNVYCMKTVHLPTNMYMRNPAHTLAHVSMHTRPSRLS
jgi:hypothetical protein